MLLAGIRTRLASLWYPAASGRRQALARALLLPLLLPLSAIYGSVLLLRELVYRTGLVRAAEAGVAVISVGSVSVGGAGKTPLVIYLAGRCRALGRAVVVVSRGYGGPGSDPAVVEPGSGQGADEARLVAARTGCPVVTGVDRVAACRKAVRLFSPDLIILDDGFQHRRLARTADLVISPGRDERLLLPAGPLREPRWALARADMRLSTGTEVVGLVRDVGDADGRVRPLTELSGLKVLALAGVARPAAFFELLGRAGPARLEEMRFADHQPYGPSERSLIAARAEDSDIVVTTEKDMVKLAGIDLAGRQLLALRIRSLPDRAAELDELLRRT